MNRRNLLKSAVTIPLAGALSACRGEENPRKSRRGTLKVILNGPFGTVLHSQKNYQITAYVPSDPAHEHELRFRGPAEIAGRESKTGKPPTYSYRVFDRGLDIHQGRPHIDQGFYDFNFPHIGEWKLPPNPFVVIELPRPDYITFIPPAELVVFGGKTTLQPVNQILEYEMADPDDVRVKAGERELRPTPCSELLKQYEDYLSKSGDANTNPETSQRGNTEEMLRSCSTSDLCLFFGVGVYDQRNFDLAAHGFDFFNNVLLPSLFPGLRRFLQKFTACNPSRSEAGSSPELVPAVFRYPQFQPRLLQVAAVLDCHRGGALGTTP